MGEKMGVKARIVKRTVTERDYGKIWANRSQNHVLDRNDGQVTFAYTKVVPETGSSYWPDKRDSWLETGEEFVTEREFNLIESWRYGVH
jgi:hypothetical protein